MRWFGRKAAEARPALMRGAWGVAAGEAPRSYEAQVREAYLGNAVAQRAVRLVGGHVAGERFILIEPEALAAVDAGPIGIGTGVEVVASGIGDPVEGIIARGEVRGEALRPPAAVHLRATWEGDAIRIGWARRSRAGWSWNDGVETPLGEEAERYRLTITCDGRAAREIELGVAHHLYTAAEQVADGVRGGANVEASVVQLGTYAPSRPSAPLRLPLIGDQ